MDSTPHPTSITQIKQYRLLQELGRGSMGSVYEGIDNRDGSRVAIKILHPWLEASDPTFRDRFEREAHIAALLRSPYSVRLLDFGVAGGTYFLVMEFVEGTTVAQALQEGPIEPRRALRIGSEVARALEEASARGVVHRDIKPDNILLTTEGRVKVTDFGIARQEGGAGFTSAGGFAGTPEFAAPEQIVGDCDHRTDIYALGATLYCMLTGYPPFQGGSAWDILRAHQQAQLPMGPLAHFPDSVINPIRRCLEKDPRDRYQSATELAGALERASATMTGAIPRPPSAHPGGSQVQPPAAPLTPPPPAAPATLAAPPAPGSAVTVPAGAGGEATIVGGRQGGTPLTPGVEQTLVNRAPAAVEMALEADPTPGAANRFRLVIVNRGAAPVTLQFATSEHSGTYQVAMQPVANAPPGLPIRLPVELQRRPGTRGGSPAQFQVAAMDPSGAVLAVVTGVAAPPRQVPGRRNRPLLIAAGVGLAAAIIAVIVVVSGSGGGGSTPAGGGITAVATSSGSPGIAGRSIKALARWDYAFRVVATTCAFGAKAGDPYPVSFRFQPANGNDGVLNDGDLARVTGIKETEVPLGTFTFRMQDFEVIYPVAGTDGRRGVATLLTTFADDVTIGEASLTERYETSGCAITLRATK